MKKIRLLTGRDTLSSKPKTGDWHISDIHPLTKVHTKYKNESNFFSYCLFYFLNQGRMQCDVKSA